MTSNQYHRIYLVALLYCITTSFIPLHFYDNIIFPVYCKKRLKWTFFFCEHYHKNNILFPDYFLKIPRWALGWAFFFVKHHQKKKTIEKPRLKVNQNPLNYTTFYTYIFMRNYDKMKMTKWCRIGILYTNNKTSSVTPNSLIFTTVPLRHNKNHKYISIIFFEYKDLTGWSYNNVLFLLSRLSI